MLIVRIVADPIGPDRALNSSGHRRGAFINLNEEYVELWNDTERSIDISRWRLQNDARQRLHTFVFPEGTQIPPWGSIKIRSGEGINTASDFYWNRQMPVWNNTGDTAWLLDSMGRVVDRKQYPLLPCLRAETSYRGGAVDLLWDIPVSVTSEEALSVYPMQILRRVRRFPGKNRRGILPVEAKEMDGDLVFHSDRFTFDFNVTQEEWFNGDQIVTTNYFRIDSGSLDRQLVCSLRQRRILVNDSGETVPIRMTVRLVDCNNLEPQTIYYYTAFVGPRRVFNSLSQASALVTKRNERSLFALLPQIHQQLDTQLPNPAKVERADQHKGQLQRFLEVFDHHADVLQGMVKGLRDLHNPRRIDSRLLSAMAHHIGWRMKHNLDEDQQRNEIMYAPEVYKTIGTIPTIKAIINHLTGWDAQIKEFVSNIIVSFDSHRLEEIEKQQTWYLDGDFRPSQAYSGYLDGNSTNKPSADKRWQGNRLPKGSVDTTKINLYSRKNQLYDDDTVYTYDFGTPDGKGGYVRDDRVLYNRETIGIYIVPDLKREGFIPEEEAERIRKILKEFLPIQVRPVFFIRPVDAYEDYETRKRVREELTENFGILAREETNPVPKELVTSRIPE